MSHTELVSIFLFIIGTAVATSGFTHGLEISRSVKKLGPDVLKSWGPIEKLGGNPPWAPASVEPCIYSKPNWRWLKKNASLETSY